MSLADSVIIEVAKELIVTLLWEKLGAVYIEKSLANRLYIKKRMFTLKMAEGLSLDQHIDKFNQVYGTLAIIHEPLNNIRKALLLISSLPESYKNFVDTLMYGRQILTLDEVKYALNTRQLSEKQRSLDNASNKGLKIHGRFDLKK